MAGNPFDQFDPSTPAAGSTNPFDQFDAKKATASAPAQHGALYNALFKEGGGGSGWQSADEGILPAARDYGLAALDDLTLGYGVPSGLKAATAQAQSNLGPMSYVTGAATYGLGPGKILGPAGEAIGALSPVAKGAAGMVAEGALAGGASGLSHGTGDPFTDVATGALEGGALGGAAGTVGAGIGKLMGFVKPPVTMPYKFSDVTNDAEGVKNALFKQGDDIHVNPDAVSGALASGQVNAGMRPFISTGFQNTLSKIQDAVNQGGHSANDIADYAQNLRADYGRNPNVSNADRILANQVADNLVGSPDRGIPGVLGGHTTSGQPPGAGAAWLTQANNAHRQFMLAQGLQKASQAVEDGTGNPASWASQQLDNFYTNADPNYAPASNPGYAAQRAALVKIANAGGGYQTAYNLAHAGAPVVEGLGGLAGGWLGEMGAGAAYHVFAKPALSKVMTANQKAAIQRALAEAYPTLTGRAVSPPVAQMPSGSSVGENIKNLALGTAY
jgi:hypothetical protein